MNIEFKHFVEHERVWSSAIIAVSYRRSDLPIGWTRGSIDLRRCNDGKQTGSRPVTRCRRVLGITLGVQRIGLLSRRKRQHIRTKAGTKDGPCSSKQTAGGKRSLLGNPCRQRRHSLDTFNQHSLRNFNKMTTIVRSNSCPWRLTLDAPRLSTNYSLK